MNFNEDTVNVEKFDNDSTNEKQDTPKKRPKKRKKTTASEIDKQIELLKERKQKLLDKTKLEIGNFVIKVLEKEGISLELIEDNQDLFLEELENVLQSDIDNIKELID